MELGFLRLPHLDDERRARRAGGMAVEPEAAAPSIVFPSEPRPASCGACRLIHGAPELFDPIRFYHLQPFSRFPHTSNQRSTVVSATAPRYSAILRFAKATPCRTLACGAGPVRGLCYTTAAPRAAEPCPATAQPSRAMPRHTLAQLCTALPCPATAFSLPKIDGCHCRCAVLLCSAPPMRNEETRRRRDAEPDRAQPCRSLARLRGASPCAATAFTSKDRRLFLPSHHLALQGRRPATHVSATA